MRHEVYKQFIEIARDSNGGVNEAVNGDVAVAIQEEAASLENDLRLKEQHLILDALKAERGNKRCAAE